MSKWCFMQQVVKFNCCWLENNLCYICGFVAIQLNNA